MKRGEVWLTDLDPVRGSEQAGTRPVLVLQTNPLTAFLRTVVIVPFTTNLKWSRFPFVTVPEHWHRYVPEAGNWHGWTSTRWIVALSATPVPFDFSWTHLSCRHPHRRKRRGRNSPTRPALPGSATTLLAFA